MKFNPIRSLIAGVLFAAGGMCSSTSFAQVASYNFSPVNQFDINLTAAYWNPIIAYVSEKSGVKLNLKIGRTSADTTSYVLAKEVEFIFTNHLFSPERDQLGWKVVARRQTPPGPPVSESCCSRTCRFLPMAIARRGAKAAAVLSAAAALDPRP